jgi:hypothetical protein
LGLNGIFRIDPPSERSGEEWEFVFFISPKKGAGVYIMRKSLLAIAAAVAAVGFTGSVSKAAGIIKITEFMSNDGPGSLGEWVEYTNVGDAPVDMTGWSHSDSDATPGNVPFGSTFGVVQPGESVLFVENLPATFAAGWNVPSSVKIFGPNSKDNLSSGSDQINLYDSLGAQVDQVTYPGLIGGSAGSGISLNRPFDGSTPWASSSVGDAFGSYQISNGPNIGNPGTYVPEPATLGFAVIGGALMLARRTRRHA